MTAREPSTEQILVGVTGAGENTSALRFAIDEARRRHQGVTLVHSVNPSVLPPPSLAALEVSWADVAKGVVADVCREAESLLDGDPVPLSTLARTGPPGPHLVELSRQADLVVLQHRDLSRLHRLVTGSTVAHVATHARCPVVSVPAGYGRSAHDGDHGVVTVGVRAEGGPAAVVESAFEQASLRRATVRVIHAWRLPSAYDDLIIEDARWNLETQRGIEATLADLSAKYPDVEVSVEVHRDAPAEALGDAAASSDLLVVGRHSGRLGPARLGYLARAMVGHAQCPVLVVPL